MEPIIKEKETVYVNGHHNGGYGGGYDLRARANTGVALGGVGLGLGALALIKQGGLGGIFGGGVSAATAPSTVTYNYGSTGGGGCSPFLAYSKECDDVLKLTDTIYGLKIGTMQAAQAARDVDVAEKFGLYKSQVDADFGLYVNTRDNIDAVNNRINSELFSLYKYTRDKDDETNARIASLEAKVAVNEAVRPYQDALIQCKIDDVFKGAINYIDRKTCNVIYGQPVLVTEPTVTGIVGANQCGCPRVVAAAAAGA